MVFRFVGWYRLPLFAVVECPVLKKMFFEMVEMEGQSTDFFFPFLRRWGHQDRFATLFDRLDAKVSRDPLEGKDVLAQSLFAGVRVDKVVRDGMVGVYQFIVEAPDIFVRESKMRRAVFEIESFPPGQNI